MKITSEILKRNNSLSLAFDKKLFAIVSSIFSVIFSLSIVFELSNIVDGYVLAFLVVFTVLFLIANETIKVREIRKYYNGSKSSLYGMAVTFIISFSLSGIGVWLWTNNSVENSNNNKIEVVETKRDIKADFLNRIQLVKSETFEETKQYTKLESNLDYWKGKSAATLAERNTIREHIKDIENDINVARVEYNNNKQTEIGNINQMMEAEIAIADTNFINNQTKISNNNFLSTIFFIMIFITEMGIVVLNKEIATYEAKIDTIANSKQAEYYIICRKLVESLYLSSKKGKVTIQDALHSPVMNKLDWDENKKWREVKKLYNVLINIGILYNSKVIEDNKRQILTNKISSDKKEAFNKFDNYFEKLLVI